MSNENTLNEVDWDSKLNEYKEKYVSYLKKSILGEKDEKLKTEIENLNSLLETMVKNKDTENDDLIKEIEIKRKEIKVEMDKCKEKQEIQDDKNTSEKVVIISLSKKLRNIQEKEEETKNTLFFLKCSIVFFLVCIAILLYFILK